MDVKTTECANSIFEQPWWLDIVARDSWKEVCVTENGQVKARLPYMYKKGLLGYKIQMPKLTQTLGIWMPDHNDTVGNKQFAEQKDVINQLLALLPPTRDIRIRLDHSCSYALPYLWQGFTIVPTYSYRICDLSDMDKVYQNFGKIVKKNIKSAKNKVVISEETDVDRLFQMLELTFQHQKRKYPYSKELIKEIVSECEERKAGKMLSAIDENGNVHACSYFVYDRNVCYYLISGSNPEFRSSGAQTLILWEGIQFAAKVSNAFDFEGSMIEGIETYFRAFGGDLIVNYEVRRQSLSGQLYDILKPRVKKILGYK
ncbi:MAG: GNAT family N-acetyltransferase [Candidatus Gastranaerophilales bacterium]|nr:GNAT family N-acetyltransferase [Candidatus Gastranaerophilales bacterium]